MRTSYRFLIGLLLISLPAFAQWGDFTTDTLDAPVPSMARTTNLESLEISADGFLHAVWTSQRAGGGAWILYNTTRPSGEWWTVPDTVNTPEQIAHSPVLALLPSGDPCIAYTANGELILAFSGGEWARQTIAGPPLFRCCPTLAVDDAGLPAGLPHLAWIGEDEVMHEYHIVFMRVIWGADPHMLMESMLGDFGLGANPRIAVSPEGIAHITYRGGGYEDYHIIHAYNSGSGGITFTHEPLFTPNQEDLGSDVAMHGRDVHVVVCGDDGWGMPGHVYYLVKPDSQEWSPPEDVSGRLSATGALLALDGSGVPHALLMELSGNMLTGNIHYFSRQTGAWNGSTLIGEDHFNPCLRLDASGYGHALMNTGGNSASYGVLHLRSEHPLTHAPGPFSRLLPADSATDPWYEIPNVQFVWSTSVDPDLDPVSYTLRVFAPDYVGYDESFITTDTSQIVVVPIPVLDEVFAFYWTVHATDGEHVTEAENGTGVFFVNIESADDPLLLARDFQLSVYPNPFNSAATLTYSLPRATNVSLSIYDVQGRLIQTLFDGLAAAGTHRVSFDGNSLATGVYFAHLETANVIRTQKLLLLK